MRTNRLTCLLLSMVCALSLSAADILYFNQDCNFDMAGNDNTCADERYNLLNIITNAGHTITTLPDFHVADLADLLGAHDFLLIPDLEDGFVECKVTDPDFLSPAEKTVLRSYIDDGGSILIAGSSQNVDFLNEVFNLGLLSSTLTNSGFSSKNTNDAMGTPFEACPDALPNLSATFLITSSMPANKLCIYESGINNASVAIFPVGNGYVTYLGYDFNDAGPGCAQTASLWTGCVIESAILVAEFGPPGRVIPTLSEWGVIILALLILIVGMVRMRSLSSVSYV